LTLSVEASLYTVRAVPIVGYQSWVTNRGLPIVGYQSWVTNRGLRHLYSDARTRPGKCVAAATRPFPGWFDRRASSEFVGEGRQFLIVCELLELRTFPAAETSEPPAPRSENASAGGFQPAASGPSPRHLDPPKEPCRAMQGHSWMLGGVPLNYRSSSIIQEPAASR